MKQIIDKIDAKLITSVGGIVLATFLAYAYWNTVTNHFYHMNETQIQTNTVLGDLKGAVNANTEVLKILERRLK